jgi:hypothetical protein
LIFPDFTKNFDVGRKTGNDQPFAGDYIEIEMQQHQDASESDLQSLKRFLSISIEDESLSKTFLILFFEQECKYFRNSRKDLNESFIKISELEKDLNLTMISRL